tara:strand:+ start:910 stop:1428 length:519 start_codon:yes stop_codon:yes gene_type:complete
MSDNYFDKVREEFKDEIKNTRTKKDAGIRIEGQVSGVAHNSGTITNNYYKEPAAADVTRKFDDSAVKQGRKPIGMRQLGICVNPSYMTPKEYQNFSKGIWDGVERRKNCQDWQAWDWAEDHLQPKAPNNTAVEQPKSPGEYNEFQEHMLYYIAVFSCLIVILTWLIMAGNFQ